MSTVYAIANQKGGVGKTTTAVNVAACIAEAGYPTLLVDVDPQGNATTGLGVAREAPGLYDVLGGDVAVQEALRESDVENLSLLVSTPDLAGATMELPRLAGSEQRLREALAPVRERFGFILLDCPPSLGPLTVNALVAADRVIVPVQTEDFALEGLAGVVAPPGVVQPGPNPRAPAGGGAPGAAGHDGSRAAGAQPAADRGRDAPDDARRTDPARPGRGGRGPPALPDPGLRDGDPAQHPARRGPELRPRGHPPRPALRGLGGVLRPREGGGGTWLSANAAWVAAWRRS